MAIALPGYPMPRQIDLHVGTLILQERLLLPKNFKLTTEAYSEGWNVLSAGDVFTLDRSLRLAGWNFFRVAGMLEASVIGSIKSTSASGQKQLRKAIKRVLTTVRAHNFNCVEISRISGRYFLGIPYVTVFAQSRHIQESPLLQNIQERSEAK